MSSTNSATPLHVDGANMPRNTFYLIEMFNDDYYITINEYNLVNTVGIYMVEKHQLYVHGCIAFVPSKLTSIFRIRYRIRITVENNYIILNDHMNFKIPQELSDDLLSYLTKA